MEFEFLIACNQVENSLPVAGIILGTYLPQEAQHVYRQIKGLTAYRAHVFAQKFANLEQFEIQGRTRLVRPLSRELRRLWCRRISHRPISAYYSEAHRLQQQLQKQNAELVHIYFGQNAIYWRRWLTRKKIPAIISFHGADGAVGMTGSSTRVELARVFSAADRVLVRSRALQGAVSDLGCPEEKLRIQRTGIPVADFVFRQRTLPQQEDVVLLQACRLIEKKGVDDTLRLCRALKESHPNVRLVVAGDGPLRQQLQQLANELELRDCVEWAGFVSQQQLKQYYARAHLFVHPSRVTREGDSEGVPNSMLEAMACGIPVATTRHGGIPEAVTDGHEGILVAEGDWQGLARRVNKLLNSPERYADCSGAASRRIHDEFNSSLQLDRLQQHYDDVRNS